MRDWYLKDTARETRQTSDIIKRRPSQLKAKPKKDQTGEGWSGNTKKKGPGKRTHKNSRSKGPGSDVYW